MIGSAQGWSALHKRAGEWMQIDLGLEMVVSGFVTQRRKSDGQRVTAYKIAHSKDGKAFTTLDKVFIGNTGNNELEVKNAIDTVVTARYVRCVVQKWSGHISMRAAVMVGMDLGADFTIGEKGSVDGCPPGYSGIVANTMCIRAASVLGYGKGPIEGFLSDLGYHNRYSTIYSGCFFYEPTSMAYFNLHLHPTVTNWHAKHAGQICKSDTMAPTESPTSAPTTAPTEFANDDANDAAN